MLPWWRCLVSCSAPKLTMPASSPPTHAPKPAPAGCAMRARHHAIGCTTSSSWWEPKFSGWLASGSSRTARTASASSGVRRRTIMLFLRCARFSRGDSAEAGAPLLDLLVGDLREQHRRRIDLHAVLELVEIFRHRAVGPWDDLGRRHDRLV